ncbi:MAG TPA: hypothetical protein VNV44_00255 [Solirubrobacteraceae bacterium]|jgi:hypothetical protein|nr:hypothetical protein [Solirubrobacteraceae bacterium]
MKRWRSLPSPRRAVVAAAVTAGSLAALGAAPAASSAAPLPTLNVSVTKTSITASGSTVSGAVNIVTTAAKGLKEPATLLFLLKPGVSVAEFEAFAQSKKFSDPNNAGKLGSIVFDDEGKPGGAVEAQTVLSPGTYILLNVEGEHPTHPPHSTLTITPAPAPAALPAAQATERTIEFGFKGPSTLKEGEVVRFENEGFLVHMNIAFPVGSRHAATEAVRDLKLGREKAVFRLVKGQPFAFYGPLGSGAFQQETITEKPGWYVQACFMETQDGRVHTTLGMERAFRIVK